ncbi:MAG: hypothetical protein CVU41_13005 [Chloroflexi bacterium HGW-Chloroflexi-3]|nr:MAG: hypothetical protein CVU41_13005 [Chloroflexi bacterium HGW-Chloroflexi-3]
MMNLIKKLLLVFSLLFLFVIILKSPISETTNIGTGDYRPYWSATYLLAHGQDFSNPGLMDGIERTLTNWNKPFTMMAWFAPTGMVILLPFTILPFKQAAFFWLLTNILVLSSATMLIWSDVKRKIWIPLLAVFGFPMTLLSLYVGQINTLVLFGLIVFISLKKPEHHYLRGIGLALTTIKPHLVILSLPLIILDSIYKKHWKILIGFFGSLLVCVIILFAFLPSWPISFWNLVISGMSTIRETPTLSGLLAYTAGKSWGKWIWVLSLLLTISLWSFREKTWNEKLMIDVSLIIGLLISPIGWGYDQILLTIPIVNLFKTIFTYEEPKTRSIFFVVFLFAIYFITYIMRVYSINEMWFFLVPILLGGLYCYYIFAYSNEIKINNFLYYYFDKILKKIKGGFTN